MADSNGDGDSLPAVASGATGTMDKETAPSKLAASKQLEDCKKEESARRDFCKAIEAVSKALNVLPDTDFKASLVEPIKNLEAAGDVGIIIAADAARSAQSFVDSIAEEKESQAKEKEALGAVAEAEAKAKVARGAADMWSATVKAATAKRKSLERGAGGGGDVSQKRSSPTGGAGSGSGAGGSGSSAGGSGSGAGEDAGDWLDSDCSSNSRKNSPKKVTKKKRSVDVSPAKNPKAKSSNKAQKKVAKKKKSDTNFASRLAQFYAEAPDSD